MVLNANDLLEWKDFPKGLRVLLLEQETDSAAQTRSKLEEMDYIGQISKRSPFFLNKQGKFCSE